MGADGSRKGTSNSAIMRAMEDIRCVGDLEAIRASQSPVQVWLMVDAIKRLIGSQLIPASADVPHSSLREAFDVLHSEPYARGDNRKLLKLLWQEAKVKPAIKSYINLVIRLWLIAPAESVVESMGSVLKEVFGTHRQLKHENAAKELVVRWNGPDVCHAGSLLRAVQDKKHFNFVRRSVNAKQALEGTVISRHKASKSCRVYFYP